MTLASNPKFAAIIGRVKNILLEPTKEWEKIDGETATIQGLFTDYALIVAAVPAVCGFLGAMLFGYSGFGVTVHLSFMAALSNAIVSYVLSLAGVLILGFVIDFLAPHFQSQKNQISAFKLATYSSTAAWAAGIFGLVPALAVLGLLGLYSVYLLYCGLPQLMKTPVDKRLGYTASIFVAAIVVGIILSLITAPLRMMGAGARPMMGESKMSGQLALPNGYKIDMGEMQNSLRSVEAAAKTAADAPPAKAIPVESLKALLPESLPGGFARSEVSANGGVAGMNLSSTEATYRHDPAHITVRLTDMGTMAPIVGMMGMLGGTEQSKETADSYSKTGEVNGRITNEDYNRSSNSGHYSVMAAKRIMVEASGSGISMDDLKGAVATIGPEKVEGLVR